MEQLDTLEKAIDLFRSGDKATASRILAQHVTQYPKDDAAWLWLAASLEQPDQQIYCLQKAQALNPANPATPAALKSYLGLDQQPRVAGSPINLPPPAVPAEPEDDTDIRAEIAPEAGTGKKSLSSTQVLILLVLVAAIVVVIAALAYLVISANPNLLPPFLRSAAGTGNLLLLP